MNPAPLPNSSQPPFRQMAKRTAPFARLGWLFIVAAWFAVNSSPAPAAPRTASVPPNPAPLRTLLTGVTNPIVPETAVDLSGAILAGRVSAEFHGRGSSSGDSVSLTVRATGTNSLELSIPPGTRLLSGNGREQNMVVAAVKGESKGGGRYSPRKTILAGLTPATYVLEAYCAEFHKDNPSSATSFRLGAVDPVLACIFREGAGKSLAAKQAAVWIYTDKVTRSEVTRKFSVSSNDWNAAQALLTRCCIYPAPLPSRPEPATTPAQPESGPRSEPARRVETIELKGIFKTPPRSSAILNDKLVREGESVTLTITNQQITLRCLKITDTAVTIETTDGKRAELRLR